MKNKIIYIIYCENNYYYVGQTNSMYHRYKQHLRGEGSCVTLINEPIEIVAMYNYETFNEFYRLLNGDNVNVLHLENIITEILMINNYRLIDKIKGGKYIKLEKSYIIKKTLLEPICNLIPVCHCGFPCDVQKQSDNNFVFKCPKTNINDTLCDRFNFQNIQCNYSEIYTTILINKYKDKITTNLRQCIQSFINLN